jgi:hypothetical protein
MFSSSPNASSDYSLATIVDAATDFTNWSYRFPFPAEIKALQAEIKGLEVMESQMSHDLQLMKRRKEIKELSKTWSGKALQALGWAFSVYCVYRVAMVRCQSERTFAYATADNSTTGTHQPDLWLGDVFWFRPLFSSRRNFRYTGSDSQSTRSGHRRAYIFKSYRSGADRRNHSRQHKCRSWICLKSFPSHLSGSQRFFYASLPFAIDGELVRNVSSWK